MSLSDSNYKVKAGLLCAQWSRAAWVMSVVFLQTIGVNLMMGERALVPNGLRERSMEVGSDGHRVLSLLQSLWQHTCSADLIISSPDFEIQYRKKPWARTGRNQRNRSELIGSWEADYSCVVDCCRASSQYCDLFKSYLSWITVAYRPLH